MSTAHEICNFAVLWVLRKISDRATFHFMHYHVIYSTGLKTAYWILQFIGILSWHFPVPYQAVVQRYRNIFITTPGQPETPAVGSSTGSQMKVVRDVLLYMEDDLSGFRGMFWLALSLQEHCSFFSPSLYKPWLQLFCQLYLEISSWMKKGI